MSNEKEVDYPMAFIPLLYQCVHLARPTMITTHRLHSWVILMMTSPLIVYIAPPSSTLKTSR